MNTFRSSEDSSLNQKYSVFHNPRAAINKNPDYNPPTIQLTP